MIPMFANTHSKCKFRFLRMLTEVNVYCSLCDFGCQHVSNLTLVFDIL